MKTKSREPRAESRGQETERTLAGSRPSTLDPRQNSLLRQWTGPLTQDLTLHPGDFGDRKSVV